MRTRGHVLTALLCALLCATGGLGMPAAAEPSPSAGEILNAVPAAPDNARRYVFYMHGRILEDEGRRPKHPAWGVYEYDQILDALSREGAVVISELRKHGTRPPAYAKGTATAVQRLLEAGVPPAHIGVVGFSKGGLIARLVSARLAAPIRYALLGACPRAARPKHALHGHVLALREKSDTMTPSCRPLFAASPDALSTREVVIDVGGGHGAFYRPDPAWLGPLRTFLRGD